MNERLFSTVRVDAVTDTFFDGDNFTYYLKADTSIKCDDETTEYRSITLLAWVAVLMYPVGLLVLNAALLFATRKAIVSRRALTPSTHKVQCRRALAPAIAHDEA